MIKEIKWNNHPILGNLVLNFCKPNGGIYNTIVLAGENGTGKTSILETMSTFLNLGSIEPFEYIKYEINGVDYTIKPYQYPELGFHQRMNENTGTITNISNSKNNNRNKISSDLEDLRHYGCVYSKARSGFSTNKVKSVTTQQLDADQYEGDTKDDFTNIKQLIIDISTQDNSDWMEITRSGSGLSFEDFILTSRIYRFEQAFNSFFETLRFKNVDNSQRDEIDILFEKNNKRISIDALSTGEKQIVFRGAHLLKNSNRINGGTALVDEPELSMHPKWQNKIMEFYRDLFTHSGTQSTQLFFATHSEYVLRAALDSSNDTLVIILNDDRGIITPNKTVTPAVLPTITSAEINYLAFDVASNDYHIELYGYLQNKIGATSVKDCDTYIASQVGKYDPNRHAKASSHGTTTYQTLTTFIRNAIDHPDPSRKFTSTELRTSIELLIELCR